MLNLKQIFANEILIVEDNQNSLAFLSELLTNHGYTIRQALDGEMALLSIKNKKPALVLLDVHLPGVDGFEVCAQIKQDPQYSDIPIVFLSALQDTQAKVRGLQLGAADYIAKPFETEEVLQRVRSVIELSCLQQKLEEMCKLRTKQLLEEINERKLIESELRDSQVKLRKLTGYLEDVREQERKRIAREIHDELGQSLTVARIDLTRLMDKLEAPADQLKLHVEGIIDVLQEASDVARAISENLRPGVLDLLGLGAALEHHVKRFKESTGIACELLIQENSEEGLSDHIATIAYRIVQEALTNVAKHARAKRVEVVLSKKENSISVSVEDDGVGIPSLDKRKHNSFGLLGMAERVQLVGGGLSITEPASGGAKIEATLPLAGEVHE